ncbi:hypothetical protein ACTXG5_25475 [Mycobacterium sp. Dal123C01]|uniref:hypothetical protein n=1 Tax=Mycobacterium sp. Dal123C01 TaxID=3457577 RepID=UPI00403EDFFF
MRQWIDRHPSWLATGFGVTTVALAVVFGVRAAMLRARGWRVSLGMVPEWLRQGLRGTNRVLHHNCAAGVPSEFLAISEHTRFMTDTSSPDPADGSEPSASEPTGNEAVVGDRSSAIAPDHLPGQEPASRIINQITLPEYDRSYANAARAAVPDIGSGSRWYDIAYRLLQWSRKSPQGKALSQRARVRISRWINILYRYHDLDRDRAWSRDDPMHNLTVPADEHVAVPTLWVVELFPPSAAAKLASIVEKYNPSAKLFEHRDSTTVLSQSRAGHGYDWFELASIKDPSSNRIVPDARLEKLPDRFWGVHLTEIQLGSGLTAVVARFHCTDEGASSLDREWHKPHEPRLRRQGELLIADDRKWSAFSGTQRVRRQSHDMAREWMNEHCGGFFAQSGENQPLMDLLIVEQYVPTDDRQPDPDQDDSFRALGLSVHGAVVISPQVPELVLTQTELDICPTLRTSRSWALWGNRSAAAAARPHIRLYNGESDTPEALGHAADDEARDMLLGLSITELIELMETQYTTVRDTARKQHRSFSSRDLQSLRSQLLTLSIDLTSLEVDVPSWWVRHAPSVPVFVYRYVDTDETLLNLTDHLRSRQIDDLTRLSKADHAIRDILSSVAALGSARDTRRVGRIALAVAALGLLVATFTLLVAVTTLLVTSPGDGSIACHTWRTMCGPAGDPHAGNQRVEQPIAPTTAP